MLVEILVFLCVHFICGFIAAAYYLLAVRRHEGFIKETDIRVAYLVAACGMVSLVTIASFFILTIVGCLFGKKRSP